MASTVVQPEPVVQQVGKLRTERKRWLEAQRNKNKAAQITHMTKLDALLEEYLTMLPTARMSDIG